MFILLMLRDSSLHILDYLTPSGKYWTRCGDCFTKEDRMNVLAIDDTIPGICSECKFISDDMYNFYLEEDLAYARNKSTPKDNFFLKKHRKNYIGPKSKYSSLNLRLPVKKKYSNYLKRPKKNA